MIITAIKQQVKRAGRYSVFVDGAYAFSLSDAGLLESRLVSGQEVNAAELRQLKKAAGMDTAYGNALRYAALRPRSEWELRDYLRRKGLDEPAAQQIIERLQGLGMVDDVAFARSWIASRRLLKAASKRQLRLELRQKHVPADVIEQVIGEDQTNDQESIKKLIEKKRKRYPDEQKLIQYLARQGFGYDDIKSALQENE